MFRIYFYIRAEFVTFAFIEKKIILKFIINISGKEDRRSS